MAKKLPTTNYQLLTTRPALLAIVGPTASGKSDLAMKIAKEFNGEIICADSRTVYKGMDIGTAKPSLTDQKAVKHWGLDLVKPGRSYNAAKFQKYAEAAIKDIQSRGKLPILAGGTGLYIDALLYDFKFSLANGERDPVNPRHLKKTDITWQDKNLLADALIIGLLPADDELKQRIAARAKAMFKQGIIRETRELTDEYGQKAVAGTAGIVYKIALKAINGEITEGQAIESFKTADWQYARRQKTWFKRNRDINWFSGPEQAYKFVQKQLLNT